MGKVVTLHLHQGAFVDIGGVYDGWISFFFVDLLSYAAFPSAIIL